METLNVVIADDHPIVLVGVRELVERDERFRVVGEAVCSNELVTLLENTNFWRFRPGPEGPKFQEVYVYMSGANPLV